MSEAFSSHGHSILNSFRRLVSTLHSASRQTEKQLGVSNAQLFALQKLQDGRRRSLGELALLTCTHQSSLSVVVHKLVNKDFVQSAAALEDSRRLVLQITAKGRQLLEEAGTSVPDRLLKAAAEMDQKDQRELDRLLSELLHRAAMSDVKAELFLEYDNTKSQE